MSHFAEIKNGIIQRVIVAEQNFINSGAVGDPKTWVQTSYNTRGGKHILGGTPLRKNYAGIGYIYDTQRDAFIPPQPFQSWKLDENSCMWVPPVEYPKIKDGDYRWSEEVLNWIKI